LSPNPISFRRRDISPKCHFIEAHFTEAISPIFRREYGIF
jgi:hypothetical protein